MMMLLGVVTTAPVKMMMEEAAATVTTDRMMMALDRLLLGLKLLPLPRRKVARQKTKGTKKSKTHKKGKKQGRHLVNDSQDLSRRRGSVDVRALTTVRMMTLPIRMMIKVGDRTMTVVVRTMITARTMMAPAVVRVADHRALVVDLRQQPRPRKEPRKKAAPRRKRQRIKRRRPRRSQVTSSFRTATGAKVHDFHE